MNIRGGKWTETVIAASLSGAVWVVAAVNGYALETLWLPAVVIAAVWPRRATPQACGRRLRGDSTRSEPRNTPE